MKYTLSRRRAADNVIVVTAVEVLECSHDGIDNTAGGSALGRVRR